MTGKTLSRPELTPKVDVQVLNISLFPILRGVVRMCMLKLFEFAGDTEIHLSYTECDFVGELPALKLAFVSTAVSSVNKLVWKNLRRH